ncbi:MAG TPA: MFS transporter [Anaerolineales bacterium]|nr:MFS transporter [Anaerolineales bacterium]
MKFSYSRIFILGFGFFGVSVLNALYNSYVPNFLQSRFGLSTSVIGVFMALDNIAALIIQPSVGPWSDRIRTKIGRRMPFILVGVPISAIAFGLIPVAAILPFFVACTTSFFLAMAFWRTPVVALMPDITPSEKRSQANGIINFMGGLGAIIAFLAGSAIYKINPGLPFWVGSGLVILAALMVYLFIKEPTEFVETERYNIIGSLVEVWKDRDKSAIRLLFAIFFWFLGYAAIEAFFTLYAKNYLGLSEADGSRLLGHLSLLFVLFAIPSGVIGGNLGRRGTISTGIILLAGAIFGISITPISTLTNVLTKLPVLGEIPGISIFLMLGGIAWSLININSLPMVVDMTSMERIGTFTGLYYLFSTLSAILGPISNGLLIDLTGGNYNALMSLAPTTLLIALVLMSGVKRGEAIA